MVVLMEVPDGPAVGDEVAGKAPVLPENLLEGGGAAADFAVGPVVGAHDSLDLSFFYAGFKSRQVGLRHVFFRGLRIERMPEPLGAGVDREVLCARGRLVVRSVALQALDKADAQARGQAGILAVGLVSPAPARVAEDVDVGRPEGESLVDVPVAQPE